MENKNVEIRISIETEDGYDGKKTHPSIDYSSASLLVYALSDIFEALNPESFEFAFLGFEDTEKKRPIFRVSASKDFSEVLMKQKKIGMFSSEENLSIYSVDTDGSAINELKEALSLKDSNHSEYIRSLSPLGRFANIFGYVWQLLLPENDSSLKIGILYKKDAFFIYSDERTLELIENHHEFLSYFRDAD